MCWVCNTTGIESRSVNAFRTQNSGFRCREAPRNHSETELLSIFGKLALKYHPPTHGPQTFDFPIFENFQNTFQSILSTKTYQNAFRIDSKQQIRSPNSLKTEKNHFLEPKTAEICSNKSENQTSAGIVKAGKEGKVMGKTAARMV